MFNIKRISFENLFSHKKSEYIFKEENISLLKLVLAQESGERSNGAGKSTILEAVMIAITGKNKRGLLKSEIIRDGENFCKVSLDLFSKETKTSLTINRNFPINSAETVEVILNDETLATVSVADANKKIEEITGINQKTIDFFIVNSENTAGFITSSDAEKKQILSKIIDLEFVDEKIQEMLEEVVKMESGLSKSKNILQRINTSISVEQSNIEKVESSIQNLKIEQAQEIENKKVKEQELEKDLEMFENLLVGFKNQLTRKEKEKVKLEKQKQEIKDSIVVLKDELKTLKNGLSEYEEEISTLQKKNRKINVSLSGAVNCPSCQTEFIPNSNIDTKKLKNELKENCSKILDFEKNTLSLQKEIKEFEDGVSVLNNQLKDIPTQELEDYIFDLKTEINTKEQNISNTKNSLAQLSKESNVESSIASLSEIVKNNKTNIVNFENDKAKLEQEMKQTEIEISKANLIVSGFKTSFKTKIVNDFLKMLEKSINITLCKYDLDIQIKIEGYKVLKSGEVKEKINVTMSNSIEDNLSFKRCSNGEKAMIQMADILTMSHIANLSAQEQGGVGFKFLLLDEIFDGLDNTGQNMTLKILSEFSSRTKSDIMIISHQYIDTSNSNIEPIYVQKNNKISKILNNNE